MRDALTAFPSFAFCLLCPALKNHLRDGVLRRVREREVRVRRAQRVEERARVAAELECRSAQLVRGDFDVMPGEAAAPARA